MFIHVTMRLDTQLLQLGIFPQIKRFREAQNISVTYIYFDPGLRSPGVKALNHYCLPSVEVGTLCLLLRGLNEITYAEFL